LPRHNGLEFLRGRSPERAYGPICGMVVGPSDLKSPGKADRTRAPKLALFGTTYVIGQT
jgi:hypothetical protein